jgi:hypothetical protein
VLTVPKYRYLVADPKMSVCAETFSNPLIQRQDTAPPPVDAFVDRNGRPGQPQRSRSATRAARFRLHGYAVQIHFFDMLRAFPSHLFQKPKRILSSEHAAGDSELGQGS